MTNRQLARTLFKMLRGSGLDYYVNYSEQPFEGGTLDCISVSVEDYFVHLTKSAGDDVRQKIIEVVNGMIKSKKEEAA